MRGNQSVPLQLGLALLVCLGAIFTALQLEGAWAFGTAASLAVGALILTGLSLRATVHRERTAATRSTVREQTAQGDLPRLDQLAVDRFGVHTPAVSIPYLTRDKEVELRRELSAGQPVLVVGHSMTGKTRMTHHVAKELYGSWPVFIPDRPDGLALHAHAEFPETVVWLDDLEGYLAGSTPLTLALLNRLERAGCRVIATMRATEYDRYQPTGEIKPPLLEVLQRFTTVRIGYDQTEQHRLANQVEATDRSAAKGIRRYGLGEYVGGGHLAINRYNDNLDSQPLGTAAIRAANDWHRLGFLTIDDSCLIELAPHYLPDRIRHDPGQTLEQALTWARQSIGGNIRLLEQTLSGYRVLDYLQDHLNLSPDEVPVTTWTAAARTSVDGANADQQTALGVKALKAGHSAIAKSLFNASMNPIADLALGSMLLATDPDLARSHFEQAALDPRTEAVAHLQLGRMCRNLLEARTHFERAAASTDARTATRAELELGRLEIDSDLANYHHPWLVGLRSDS